MIAEGDQLQIAVAEEAVVDRFGNTNALQQSRVDNNLTEAGHPSPVRELTARAGNQQAHVEWIAPTIIGDGGRYIFTYEYQRKDGNGPWGDWITAPHGPPSTGFTLKGLDNGAEYSFRVRATNTRHFLNEERVGGHLEGLRQVRLDPEEAEPALQRALGNTLGTPSARVLRCVAVSGVCCNARLITLATLSSS